MEALHYIIRHPEVLGAKRRASKGDGSGASADSSFEARLRRAPQDDGYQSTVPNGGPPMERDVKDVIGILMRVLDGGEISHEALDDLSFEADGELETALNEAYVKLREFANDRNLRLNDLKMDRAMRFELQDCLDNVLRACEPASRLTPRDALSNP